MIRIASPFHDYMYSTSQFTNTYCCITLLISVEYIIMPKPKTVIFSVLIVNDRFETKTHEKNLMLEAIDHATG